MKQLALIVWVLVCPVSLLAATPTPTLVYHDAGGMDENPASSLILHPAEPVLPGNTLIEVVQFNQSGGITVTMSDDKSNTWTAGPTITTGGLTLSSFYAMNVAGGTSQITATFNGGHPVNVQVVSFAQFYNVAQASAADGNSTGSGQSPISTGQITTTTAGDLIYQVGVNVTHPGSYNADRTTGATLTAGAGFTLLSADLQVGSLAQYRIQAAAGAITPSFTTNAGTDTWATVAIALKPATAGTIPGSGIHILHRYHYWGGTGLVTTPSTVQFPSTGNLLVVTEAGNSQVTGMSDTSSNTWDVSSLHGHSGGGDSGRCAQVMYGANATPSLTLKVTFSSLSIATCGHAGGDDMFQFYDVSGAATSPFDSASGADSGPSAVFGTTSTFGTITPTTSNGLVINAGSVYFETVGSVAAPEVFDAILNPLDHNDSGGTATSHMDEDNGFAHIINTGTSQVAFTYSANCTQGCPSGWNYWTSETVAFKAAAPTWTGIVDPTRAVDWTHAGTPVPAFTVQCGATIAPYGSQGSPSSAATINNAISACGTNQFVQLGAGTFYLNTTITFGGKNNVVLRGAGANSTKIVAEAVTGSDCNGFSAVICISGSNLYSSGGGQPDSANWTANYSQGTSSIVLANSTGITAGTTLIILDQQNEASDTGSIWNCEDQGVCSSEVGSGSSRGGVSGTGSAVRSQQQIVRVTSCSPNCGNSGSTTLTITPAIAMPNWVSGKSPQAWWGPDNRVGDGIENLWIENCLSVSMPVVCVNVPAIGIEVAECYGCWVVGVKSSHVNGAHVRIYASAHVTVRNSYLYANQAGGPNEYGLELYEGASDNLVENNIFDQNSDSDPNSNGGGVGNVAAYNYIPANNYTNSTGWFTGNDWEHAAGISYWLREGNQGLGLITDSIHGTHHFSTMFRNYYPGWYSNCNGASCTNQTIPIQMYSGSRYFNVIGNVLGRNNFHNNYTYLGNANGQSDPGNRSIYVLGATGNDGDTNTNTVITGYCLDFACSSHVQFDNLTSQTLMRWGNYDTVNNAVRFVNSEVPSGLSLYANAVPASQNLPSSFYLSGQPVWWINNFGAVPPYPATGPDITGGNIIANGSNLGGHTNNIPAEICFANTSTTPDTNMTNLNYPVLNFDASSCYTPAASGPCTPSKLVFSSQPQNASLGSPLGSIRISVEDASGNVCTSDSSTITLTNHGGTCSGLTLAGTTSGAASSGVFTTSTANETGSNLSGGISCSLDATDGALTGATSTPFTISDTTFPSPGNSGAITTSNITAASITLTWTVATDTDDTPTGLQYEVCRSLSNNISSVATCEAATIITAFTTNITTTSATGLSSNTTYFFNVVVRDLAGNKNIYSTASAKTLDNTPPMPGNNGAITLSNFTATAITLTWTVASDPDDAPGTLQYEVCRSLSNNVSSVATCEAATIITAFTTNITTTSATGLSSNTTYYFNVVVRDTAGNKNIYSTASGTTLDNTFPMPGNNGILTFTNVGQTFLTINWTKATDTDDAQAVLAYEVCRSGTANIDTVANCESNGTIILVFTTDVNTTSDSGLQVATNYFYNVVAMDPFGNKSPYTMNSQATLPGADITPPVPGCCSIYFTKVTPTGMQLNWLVASDPDDSQPVLQYEVCRSLLNNLAGVVQCENNGVIAQTFTTNISTFQASGLTPNTLYYWNVVVRDPANNKAAYAGASQMTLPQSFRGPRLRRGGRDDFVKATTPRPIHYPQ